MHRIDRGVYLAAGHDVQIAVEEALRAGAGAGAAETGRARAAGAAAPAVPHGVAPVSARAIAAVNGAASAAHRGVTGVVRVSSRVGLPTGAGGPTAASVASASITPNAAVASAGVGSWVNDLKIIALQLGATWQADSCGERKERGEQRA
jgi:hypothetical protein